MNRQGLARLLAVAGLPLASLAQPPAVAPVPADPLELVTGSVDTAGTLDTRQAALQLLTRARDNYNLRGSGRGYDLKISFTVNSGGQTQYDGAWQMEEIDVPSQGIRWTAKAGAGYETTHITVNNRAYGDGTLNPIPLRLHQARAALIGPIATPQYADHDLVRTAQATLNGKSLTCVLLSGPNSLPAENPGRGWQESEDCIDPVSGLLELHSLAPGSYEIYDYAGAPMLGNLTLPRKITVSEGGKTVMEIHVDSLTELPSADPSLFQPPPQAQSAKQGILLAQARKASIFAPGVRMAPGSIIYPVYVFGLIAPTGQFIEAHSLQPSDPNSPAAIAAARNMNFRTPKSAGARPQQHFGLVMVKFVSGN